MNVKPLEQEEDSRLPMLLRHIESPFVVRFYPLTTPFPLHLSSIFLDHVLLSIPSIFVAI